MRNGKEEDTLFESDSYKNKQMVQKLKPQTKWYLESHTKLKVTYQKQNINHGKWQDALLRSTFQKESVLSELLEVLLAEVLEDYFYFQVRSGVPCLSSSSLLQIFCIQSLVEVGMQRSNPSFPNTAKLQKVIPSQNSPQNPTDLHYNSSFLFAEPCLLLFPFTNVNSAHFLSSTSCTQTSITESACQLQTRDMQFYFPYFISELFFSSTKFNLIPEPNISITDCNFTQLS